MNEWNLADLRRKWEKLPSEELDRLLNLELAKKPPDEDLVLLLLQILESREPDEPLALTAGETAAWEAYQKRSRRRGQTKWSLRNRLAVIAASVALVLVVMFTIVPQQAEAESIWEMLQRWSAEIVEFFTPIDNQDRIVEYHFETAHPGLQEVYNAVVGMGVTEPVVPMWIPEGFELTQCKVVATSREKSMSSCFHRGSDVFLFEVTVYQSEAARQYYKTEENAQVLEYGGNQHYIVDNNGRWSVIWTKENIECSITADCQEDVLYHILKSIYVMEA